MHSLGHIVNRVLGQVIAANFQLLRFCLKHDVNVIAIVVILAGSDARTHTKFDCAPHQRQGSQPTKRTSFISPFYFEAVFRLRRLRLGSHLGCALAFIRTILRSFLYRFYNRPPIDFARGA